MTPVPNGPQELAREPRKGKRPSSAASNVEQAKAKMEQDGIVGSIAQTRAEHGVVPKTGEPTLTAIFPRKGGREPHHVDLSFLLAFPKLQSMFTAAFLKWGAACAIHTRQVTRNTLRQSFFGYLEANWSGALNPGDIDDELLAGYRESLLNKPGASGKVLHPRSVGNALGALRSIMNALDTGPWANAARYISERVPRGPIGAARKGNPTEVLGIEQLLMILDAAEREVLAVEHRLARGKELLAEGRARLLDSDRVTKSDRGDYRDLAVCLATLNEIYPYTIPDLSVIGAEHPALRRAVQEVHGHREVCSYFYPSARDLAPFVLLVTAATVFNPDTVLSLNWADISFDKDQAGVPAIEIVGTKGRATKDLVRLLDPEAAVSSRLTLKKMLSSLREATTRIRPCIAPVHADRLFLYVQKTRAKRPKGFGDGLNIGPSNDFVWKKALEKFILDNNLPRFVLGQLRPTILDLVQFMDGSLEAAQRVGNHGSPVTTWTHYTSGGVRKRYRERIGQVILLRERWMQTGGVIDPRRLTPGQDKGAATPGFSCLDPFDSQRPNQQPGRLCKDYGGCPSCPMAAAHPGDPLCVAYYTALEAAIYRSQGAMSARTWIERWTVVLADLAALRSWIPPNVLEASREISIRLPNVG